MRGVVVAFDIAVQKRDVQTVERRLQCTDAARPKIELVRTVTVVTPLLDAASKNRYDRPFGGSGGECGIVMNT